MLYRHRTHPELALFSPGRRGPVRLAARAGGPAASHSASWEHQLPAEPGLAARGALWSELARTSSSAGPRALRPGALRTRAQRQRRAVWGRQGPPSGPARALDADPGPAARALGTPRSRCRRAAGAGRCSKGRGDRPQSRSAYTCGIGCSLGCARASSVLYPRRPLPAARRRPPAASPKRGRCGHAAAMPPDRAARCASPPYPTAAPPRLPGPPLRAGRLAAAPAAQRAGRGARGVRWRGGRAPGARCSLNAGRARPRARAPRSAGAHR